MKHNTMNTNSILGKIFIFSGAMVFASVFSGCDDDPKKENTPEIITEANLVFTPVGGGTTVTATAIDPDGEGVQDITVSGPINLAANKNYTLTIELVNGLFEPTEDGYDITAEVEEEGDEHMFFFAWTGTVFSNPTGNGNIDNRADAVNYNDVDDNGLPLGLSTDWTTVGSAAAGTFRVMLKHQPDLKSASSGSTTGETDIDLTFTISIN